MILPKLNTRIILLFCTFVSLTNISHAADPSFCNANTPGQMTNRFIDLSDGTVSDSLTGLIWQRCNLGQTWDATTKSCLSFNKDRNWRGSLVTIKNFNDDQTALGLPDTWRMPNIKELTSILDLSCVYFSLDAEIFIDVQSAYWSSTPNAATITTTEVLDGNNVLTAYQDENNIWIINTQTGRDEYKGLNETIATLIVRNPTKP